MAVEIPTQATSSGAPGAGVVSSGMYGTLGGEEWRDQAYVNFLEQPAQEAYMSWRYLWFQSELAKTPENFFTMKQIKRGVAPPRLAVGKKWCIARDKEMDSWDEHFVYRWVKESDSKGYPIVDYLYVYTRKDGGVAKARCTVCGDQERKQRRTWHEIEVPTDVPTVTKEGMRAFFGDNGGETVADCGR